jgi:uncharacterized protein (UPF0332 family)
MAGLHEAQALIFERTSRVIKRHRGVQSELRRLTKDEPRFDLELSAFLGRTSNLKAVADYETGPTRTYRPSLPVTQSRRARRFVEVVAAQRHLTEGRAWRAGLTAREPVSPKLSRPTVRLLPLFEAVRRTAQSTSLAQGCQPVFPQLLG